VVDASFATLLNIALVDVAHVMLRKWGWCQSRQTRSEKRIRKKNKIVVDALLGTV
jgi:hypothetical protein